MNRPPQRIGAVVRLVGVVGVVLTAAHAQAGVYHPAEPTPFPVSPAGVATELGFGSQFEGPFPLLFTRWSNVADTRPERAANPDRTAVLARLATETGDPAAEAADLLRLDRAEAAVARLRPLSRGRSPDFRVLANLAHAHARLGQWGEAIGAHELAAFEVGVPDDLGKTTPDQRRWLQVVERKYYARWLAENQRRAARKTNPADEPVFPLFVGERPADAVAVVQQLLLWAPWDTGLYWLLAELYADAGRVREAAVILDQCADSRQHSNRKALMARRAAVKDAVAKLPPEEADKPLLAADPPAPPPAEPGKFLPSTGAVVAAGVGFAVVAAAMGWLQVRRWLRKPKGEREV